MEQNKEYFAFISYKREDEKWAKWLQNAPSLPVLIPLYSTVMVTCTTDVLNRWLMQLAKVV